MDPESPQVIRSQADSGESENNHDGHDSNDDQSTTSVSQAQFATQIPPSYQAVQALENGEKNEEAKETSIPDELRSFVSEELTAISRQVFPSQFNPREKNRIDDEIESSFVDMTVQPLLVPSSGISVENDTVRRRKLESRILTREKKTNLNTSKHISVMDMIPPVLRDLFKGLKEEFDNDKRLPHRLQVIPSDQAKLLDSNDCWQPPLVGHAQRPGVVPQVLLERLIREADQEIPLDPAAASPVHHVSEAEEAGSKRTPALGQDDDCHAANVDSNDSDSDSEAASWGESPPRPLRKGPERPPDTPPPKPIELIRLESGREISSHRRDQSVERPSAVSQMVLDEPVLGITNPVDARDESAPDDPTPSINKKTNQVEFRHPSSSAISSSNLPLVPVDPLKAIQVKRTPISMKNDLVANEPPNSSTNLIPGTFDEHSHQITKAMRHNTLSHTAETGERSSAITESYNEFENNSSEDEVVHRNIPVSNRASGVTHPSTKDKELEHLASATQRNSRKSNVSSNNIGNDYRKRKRETISRPDKRIKYSRVEQSSGHQVDPDYDQIDKDKVLYRRELLSKIGHARTPDKSNHSTGIRRMYGPQTATSQTSYQQSHTLASSPELRQHVYPDSSDTHGSVHQNIQGDAQFQPSHTSDSLQRHEHQPITMYARFKTTYPNYGGQEGNFDASCRLLKRLHSQEKATHPSLWDDFVFHHYHSYRQYLQEVIEQCGNALPYEKYYESVEPSCYQRVIRPAYLDTIVIDSRSSDQIRIQSIDRTSVVGPAQSVRPVDSVDLPVPNTLASTDRVAGNIEPHPSIAQSPQLLPEASQPIKSDQKSENFDEILQNQDSQDSHTSVSIWLHESGAESPILDSPTVNLTKESDIEVVDITGEDQSLSPPPPPPQQSNPTSTPLPPPSSLSSTQQKKKKRPLPWDLDNQTKNSPAESSKTRTKSHTILETTRTKPTTTTTTTIPSSSTSRNKIKNPPTSTTKKINSTKNNTTNSNQPTNSQSSSHPLPTPATPKPLKSPQQKPVHPPLPPQSTQESPFTRCLRQYRQLSSEKPHQSTPLTSDRKIQVDVSSWRRK